MKERLKKFYHEHEEAVLLVSTITVGVCVGYVTAKATSRQHDIILVQSDEDRTHLSVVKRNGQVSPWKWQEPPE